MDNRKPKILYLIQLPPPVHGVSTINSLIYNSPVVNGGMETCLVELKFSDRLSRLRRNSPGKIIKLLRMMRRLRKTLAAEKPDLVYFSIMPVGKGFWRDLLFVRILKRHPVRIIYHLHNRGLARNAARPLWRAAYRYAFAGSVIFHLSGKLVREEIFPLGLPGAITYALNNGIPGPEREKTEAGRDDKTTSLTLLFLSNFFPEKGIYDVLRIMYALREDPEIRLNMVGDFVRRRYKRKILRRVSSYGLNDRVSVDGPVYLSARDETYRHADMFIFPSRFSQECFPLVILEAMSRGLPVIASKLGAIPDMITDGREGILCEPGNIDGFAAAVRLLARDAEKRDQLGQAARNKFISHYTLERFEENVRAALDEILLR